MLHRAHVIQSAVSEQTRACILVLVKLPGTANMPLTLVTLSAQHRYLQPGLTMGAGHLQTSDPFLESFRCDTLCEDP